MREKVTEKIQIAADISIPAALQDVVLPIEGSQAYSTNGEISCSLISIEETRTCFRVILDTEVDLPNDLTDEELAQIVNIGSRNHGSLFIPGFSPPNEVTAPFQVLFDHLRQVVWKLVCAAEDVRFLRELDYKKMDQHFGPLTITCKGKTSTSGIPKNCFPRFADAGPFRPPTPLTKDKVQQCLSNPLERYEEYCVLSDIEYPRLRQDMVVVMLVTMLETEAYNTARKIKPNKELKHFNVRLYLGDCNYLDAGSPFYKCHPQAYKDCRELWGSRHEIVHNGREVVRVYEDEHKDGKYDRRNLTSQDIGKFRAASLAAIEWMRKLPEEELSG
jgi:hypothetical protein